MPTPALQKQNIVVTGGAGFIGSHLCERLLRDGHRVICIDNMSTGNVRNLSDVLPNPDFQFLRLDINEPIRLDTFSELSAFNIPFQGIQAIYHLACPTSITQFDQYRLQTLLASSVGTHHVLELARTYNARVLLGSSSVVYGARNKEQPVVTETDLGMIDTISPRACYDEGRRFAETAFATYQQVYNTDIRIGRIFRTYGPRMPLFDGHLIPDFILNALDGKDLIVYDHGGFHSSFVYVTDVVDGLIRLMNAPSDPGPANIGSDRDLLIDDVANMIVSLTGSSSKVTSGADLLFLSELPLPRIDRMRELGWLPLVRFEDGLKKTIEYMKANKILLSV